MMFFYFKFEHLRSILACYRHKKHFDYASMVKGMYLFVNNIGSRLGIFTILTLGWSIKPQSVKT